MAELNLDTMADYLSYIWLKDVNANDYQQTTQTLLAVLRCLTESKIDNLMTFAAPNQPLSYLTSPFLYALRYFGGSFSECSSFPYEQTTTNEWFTIPPNTELREQAVNVINVDKNGKTSKCYTTQNQLANFPESLSDADHEVFFHGTRHTFAQDIIEYGIDVKKGGRGQDFSYRDGFYLNDKFDEAWRWPHSRGYPNSAVLIFRIKTNDLQRENKKLGLDLRDDKERWLEIVSQFRSGNPSKSLKKYEFIEGPMASISRRNLIINFDDIKQKEGTYQLCIKKTFYSGLFDGSLHSVVFFES